MIVSQKTLFFSILKSISKFSRLQSHHPRLISNGPRTPAVALSSLCQRGTEGYHIGEERVWREGIQWSSFGTRATTDTGGAPYSNDPMVVKTHSLAICFENEVHLDFVSELKNNEYYLRKLSPKFQKMVNKGFSRYWEYYF